jgi:hypothetical protein
MPVWLVPVFLLIGFLLGWISRGSNESGVTIIPPRSPEELDGRVRGLLAQGRTIEAIKIYRQFHHVGLKDAKDIVEAMERNLVLPPN